MRITGCISKGLILGTTCALLGMLPGCTSVSSAAGPQEVFGVARAPDLIREKGKVTVKDGVTTTLYRINQRYCTDPVAGVYQCTDIVGDTKVVETPDGDSTVTTTLQKTVNKMQGHATVYTSVTDKIDIEVWRAGVLTSSSTNYTTVTTYDDASGVCRKVTTTYVYEEVNGEAVANDRTQVVGTCR